MVSKNSNHKVDGKVKSPWLHWSAIGILGFFGVLAILSCNKKGNAPSPETADSTVSEVMDSVDSAPSVAESTADPYAGHEYVDLGLPSGLKWATCNVGASKPEDYGDYFAWGETKPKDSYEESNSLTYGKEMSELRSSGIINNNGNLTPDYDAARKNWGGSWRMPTKDEMQELIDNCTTEWTTQNGVNGQKVTSKKNGKSIFLPAAGTHDGEEFLGDGVRGNYWLSSPSEDFAQASYALGFFSVNFGCGNNVSRCDGFSVRPVSE